MTACDREFAADSASLDRVQPVTAVTPGQAAGLLDPLHALAAKWDANAARIQAHGQFLLDQGDEYGSEGLAVAEALGACVVELRAVLDAAQQPQPAPAQPRPGYVTVNARDIAIALNGYAGFTGDPASFASELHERLRRTVFADQAPEPQPAPGLATVDLHRWYAVINQPDGTSKVIGHTDDGLGYYDSVDEWEAKNS